MSKFKTGLLLLNNQNNLYTTIKEAGKLITQRLYIDFLQGQSTSDHSQLSRNDYFQLFNRVYSRPEDVCRELDLHVLLPATTNGIIGSAKRQLSGLLDVCIVENTRTGFSEENIKSMLESLYGLCGVDISFVDGTDNASQKESTFENIEHRAQNYSGVVIGGTFDHMHDGHKLLISTALLMADEKITVGVTDGVLLEKKVLKELIEPIDERIRNVVDLIKLYKPELIHKVVPITDPVGPSGTDGDLQLLVVSDETVNGASIVNEKRKENGLPHLDVLNVHLVGESPTDLSESFKSEGKLSSSAERMRLLGTLRKPPNHIGENREGCYVVGVAGGIASGKSSMVSRLKKLGAYTIDCDKLGHETYKPGMPAYMEIVKQFGTDIVDEDTQEIIRRKLGSIVFSDPSKLQLLNSIVWPEIHRMKKEKIAELSKEGKLKVVFFEGAVLFEAGWDHEADEVWCCIIPKDEAVQRIMDRNGLSRDNALRRVESQKMTNQERVNRSHVVLSTFWEREFSQKQCEKAWELLNERLQC